MQVSDEASFVESPDQIVPGWHLGLNCLFELDAAAFHFGNQVDATQRKEQEEIGINFFAQLVDGGCNVLARHRPIRTRARHLQILPARRENANAERLGNVGNFGTQFSRGEARHDERRFGETVNKTCHVRLVDRRKRDLDFKGEVEATAAGGAGPNTAFADLGGTWLEWGLGASFNLTDRTFAYVDLERTTGTEADEKVRYSVGVRHVW